MKGCRIKKRSEEYVNVGSEGCTPQKGLSHLQRLWMNTLRMDFVGAFLELWLGMKDKHVVFLELWLKMADGTSVSV